MNYKIARHCEARMKTAEMTLGSKERTVEAPYCERSLTANSLEDKEWARALPIAITRKWTGESAPTTRHAETRIIWTPDSLLARFVCRQHEPLTVNANPQFGQKTIGLWHQDVCEIFVAPDLKAPGRYFEFEASPLGEWVDLAINFTAAGRETDFEFQSGMTTAALVGADQITVAIQIPWSNFLPRPTKGDVWRVNLFRCVGKGDDRYLAWQPTYAPEPNFHVPEVFGQLHFL
jgi:hypothetical protein